MLAIHPLAMAAPQAAVANGLHDRGGGRRYVIKVANGRLIVEGNDDVY
jgi:hypothetical protein